MKGDILRRILAYLREHPGATARELGRECHFDHLGGGLCNALRNGHIYSSGPHGHKRYYVSREQADQEHERLCVEAEAKRRKRIDNERKKENLREKLKRAKVPIAPKLKVVVAPPPPPRWVPEGFVGEFVREWKERRA